MTAETKARHVRETRGICDDCSDAGGMLGDEGIWFCTIPEDGGDGQCFECGHDVEEVEE